MLLFGTEIAVLSELMAINVSTWCNLNPGLL